MAYSTDELIRLMRSEVIDPATMLGMQEQQYAAQDARRQARREAKTADADALVQMLSQVQSTAYDEARKGTDFPSLLLNPTMSSASSQLGSETLAAMLSPYFHGATNPDSRNYGISRLKPTLPIDVDDDIFSIVKDEWEAGNTDVGSITSTVSDALGYGPKVGASLSPQITEKVQRAVKAVRGY